MEKNNPVETDLIRPALAAVCERMTMLQQAQLLVAALRIERGDPEPAGRRGTGPRRLTADGLRLLERFWNFYEAHAEKLNHSRRTSSVFDPPHIHCPQGGRLAADAADRALSDVPRR